MLFACAGIVRSELYEMVNTTTPYNVTVQTITDVSILRPTYFPALSRCSADLEDIKMLC